jgi:hypothetical protein
MMAKHVDYSKPDLECLKEHFLSSRSDANGAISFYPSYDLAAGQY